MPVQLRPGAGGRGQPGGSESQVTLAFMMMMMMMLLIGDDFDDVDDYGDVDVDVDNGDDV